MNTEWIVVADASAARIFERHQASGELKRVKALHHAESRAHEGDLRTGGKGTMHESTASSANAPEPQTTTSEKHADIFAKQVAEFLKSALNDHSFDRLVIAAAPAFLGRLRDQMDSPLSDTVGQSIDKNWAQQDDDDIARLLAKADD